MATTIKTQPNGAAKMQRKQIAGNAQQEPKRLSKFALWRRENPEGILIVKDWRAVNK